MTHEELEEALPLYAAGALDRPERQALEAHLLSGCPACHTALKDFQSVAGLLPFGLTPAQPSRALKARIMAARNPVAVGSEDAQKEPAKPSLEPGEWMNHLFPPVSQSRSGILPWGIAFASLVLTAIGGYFAWDHIAALSDETAKLHRLETTVQDQSLKLAGLQRELGERERSLSELQQDLERKATDLADLKEQVIERDTEMEALRTQLTSKGTPLSKRRTPQDELAALLHRPDIRVISMVGSEMAKTASAMLLYDAGSKRLWLYAVNLPECLNGTLYQLWAIDQKAKSIGTFHMDSGETAHLLVTRVPDFEQAKKFALSLEPPGGRPQPTGPIYLVSQS